MSVQILTGDYLEVRAYCTMTDQLSINTFRYFVLSATGTPDDHDTLVQWTELAAPLYKGMLNQEATYYGASLNVLRGALRFVTQVSSNKQGAGTLNTKALPRQTCGLTRLKTPFSGRRYQGRIFWPFPGYAAPLTGSVPDTIQQAAWINAANALAVQVVIATGTGASTLQPVIFHRPSRKPNQPPPPEPSLVVDRVTPLKFATQRRRSSFGRTNPPPF